MNVRTISSTNTLRKAMRYVYMKTNMDENKSKYTFKVMAIFHTTGLVTVLFQNKINRLGLYK